MAFESARTSRTNFVVEGADPAVLEKIESQRAVGEYSPARSFSEEKIDDSSLEKGPVEKGADNGRAPASQRPTGFRVKRPENMYLMSSGHC